MTNEAGKRWTRWLLAVWEGVLFGWFLFMIFIASQNMIQVAEFVWHPRPDEKLPRLTIWMQNVFPEEAWSLLTGITAFSIGFGLISLGSKEASSSRLFRWAIVGSLTLIVGVSLPAMEAFKNLSGGPDGRLWDEVLFVAIALSVLVYGIIRIRPLKQH